MFVLSVKKGKKKERKKERQNAVHGCTTLVCSMNKQRSDSLGVSAVLEAVFIRFVLCQSKPLINMREMVLEMTVNISARI